MTDAGSAASSQVRDLADAYPAWRVSQDGEHVFTASSPDGTASMTARSPAELECMLHNEMWKPLAAAYGYPRSAP